MFAKYLTVPIEDLTVHYDILGWSVGPAHDTFRIAITAAQAAYLIRAINRAFALGGLCANLRNI